MWFVADIVAPLFAPDQSLREKFGNEKLIEVLHVSSRLTRPLPPPPIDGTEPPLIRRVLDAIYLPVCQCTQCGMGIDDEVQSVQDILL